MDSLPKSISFEDAAQVRKIQAGDMAAFEQLVVKYQDRIYNLCMRMLGHADDADDVTQETFIKVFQVINQFEHKSSFYTWIFRIAVNLSISHRRKDQRIKVFSLNADADDQDAKSQDPQAGQVMKLRSLASENQTMQPADELRRRETREAVSTALQQLDEDQRVILVLRDIESLNYQTIAEILEVPLGTVRSRLHRARLALRDVLKPMMERVG